MLDSSSTIIERKKNYFCCPGKNNALDICLWSRIFVYVNDVNVRSFTKDEHIHLLQVVATRLEKANLTVKQQKFNIFRCSVMYLEFVVNAMRYLAIKYVHWEPTVVDRDIKIMILLDPSLRFGSTRSRILTKILGFILTQQKSFFHIKASCRLILIVPSDVKITSQCATNYNYFG